MKRYITGIGQDSHRFLKKDADKKCIIAGVYFENTPGFDADSDGDVVFHSICNAITSITHIDILGDIAIELCKKEGITDSSVYLKEAVKTLEDKEVIHVAISLEGKKPFFKKRYLEMRKNISKQMQIDIQQVGITSTSGDELTSFGKGYGVHCFCSITVF